MNSFLLQKGSYDLNAEGMRTFKDPNPTRYSYLVGHENPYFIQGEEKRWGKKQGKPAKSKRTKTECNNNMNYKKALDQNVSGKLTLSKPYIWSQTQGTHKWHLRDTLFLTFYCFYCNSLSPRIKCSLPTCALMIGFLLPQAWLTCLIYVNERWTLNNHSSVFLVISYHVSSAQFISYSVFCCLSCMLLWFSTQNTILQRM